MNQRESDPFWQQVFVACVQSCTSTLLMPASSSRSKKDEPRLRVPSDEEVAHTVLVARRIADEAFRQIRHPQHGRELTIDEKAAEAPRFAPHQLGRSGTEHTS